jgi:hypothetical protein
MAVSATTNSVSYTGNGSTTSFAVTFAFQGTGSTAELEVIERTIATGAETTKSYTTHYTVTGGNGSTGAVVAESAPADTVQWHIRRTTTRTQTVDYTTNDPFPADTHELALDRLAMGLQEVQGELDRSFKVSRTTSITTPEFVDDAATRASKLLGFASDGNSIEAVTGRVNTVTASTVTPTAGAAGSSTASFTAASGALALGLAQGSTGMAGGISLQYSTTTTDSDPGAGFFRGNNTSLNSCTILYIDDSDGTTDITAQVQSWDDSTNTVKGFITIHGNPNPALPYVVFKVTAITDATGYTKVTVAYVAGATSISNNAEVSLSFTRAGHVGDPDDVLTTRGDIIARDASAAARLAIGAANTVLKTDGTDPTWGTVSTAMIGADQITNAKIADDQIDSEHYVDGSIDTAHLADNAISLAKMAGLARGKIISGDASGDPQALALGGSGTVLTSDGTDAAWAAAAAGGKLLQAALIPQGAATSTSTATGTSATAITNLAFTPTSASSKLYVLLTGDYANNVSGGTRMECNVYLSHNGGGSEANVAALNVGMGVNRHSTASTGYRVQGAFALSHRIDSPGTSEFTIQVRANGVDILGNASSTGWVVEGFVYEIAD